MKVHTYQSLLTFDKIHQVSQIFYLKIHYTNTRHLYLFGKEAILGLLGLNKFIKLPTTGIFNIHEPPKGT